MKILGISLGIFAFIILAIFFIRVRALIIYDSDGFKAKLKIWFYTIDFKSKADKKEEQAASGKSAKAKRKGKLSNFTDVVLSAISIAPQAIRSIRIDLLDADVAIASDDACKTAILYGSLAAGCGIILPVLENNFKIKKKKIRVDADFEADEIMLQLSAVVSVAVWQILWLAICFLKKFLQKKRESIQKKGMNDNGRTCA